MVFFLTWNGPNKNYDRKSAFKIVKKKFLRSLLQLPDTLGTLKYNLMN